MEEELTKLGQKSPHTLAPPCLEMNQSWEGRSETLNKTPIISLQWMFSYLKKTIIVIRSDRKILFFFYCLGVTEKAMIFSQYFI